MGRCGNLGKSHYPYFNREFYQSVVKFSARDCFEVVLAENTGLNESGNLLAMTHLSFKGMS